MIELKQYIRDQHGHPTGVVVATGFRQVGWSLKNRRDRWDKDLGLTIARGRARNGFNTAVPPGLEDVYREMFRRSERYFKPEGEEQAL